MVCADDTRGASGIVGKVPLRENTGYEDYNDDRDS